MFIFRADGNKLIGSGHVMRCLSIANAAKEIGYKSIALGVNCDNTAAVNLYKKLGFIVYEEAEDKDGKFYRMEKKL